MRGPLCPRWAWDRQRSMREQGEASLGPPGFIDILASIGDRDDRGGGEEPARGEYIEGDAAPWPTRRRCVKCEAWLGMQNPDDTCNTCKTRTNR